jgi:hypothetical protein
MTHLLQIFTGTRRGDYREVRDVKGVLLVSSQTTACDWGRESLPKLRLPVSQTLLFHAGLPYDETTAHALGVVTVRMFDTNGFSITPEQLHAWHANFDEQRKLHGEGPQRRKRHRNDG